MNKPIVSLLFVMLMGLFFRSYAENYSAPYTTSDTLTVSIDSVKEINSTSIVIPAKDTLLRKKLISSFFAFPFPFGFMGAHRVMLGTKPWVPVVYVATLGGCFGLLPLIDFCVIVFSKDIEQYENNPNIFMWVK